MSSAMTSLSFAITTNGSNVTVLPENKAYSSASGILTAGGLINVSIGIFSTVVTFLGQILVFVVVFTEPKLRTPNNYFIVSLATADLLISVISMPVWTTYTTLGYWPLSQTLCDIWNGFDYVLCIVSVYTVLFISVDRYITLKYPFKYALIRKSFGTKIILICIWVGCSLVFGSAIGVTQHMYGPNQYPTDQCSTHYLTDKVLMFFIVVPAFWTPVIVTWTMYLMISRIAISSGSVRGKRIDGAKPFGKRCRSSTVGNVAVANVSQGIQFCQLDVERQGGIDVESKPAIEPKPQLRSSCVVDNQTQSLKKEREKKTMKTIALLLLTYCICWLPVSFALVLESFHPGITEGRLMVAGYWLGYLNSTLNPVCYAAGNPTFRQALLRLICKQKSLGPGQTYPVETSASKVTLPSGTDVKCASVYG